MKRLMLITSIAWLGWLCENSAFAQDIQPEDLVYLYVAESSYQSHLYDIRQKTPLIRNIGQSVMHYSPSSKRIFLDDERVIRTYNTKGEKIAEVLIDGLMSPDFSYKLFIKNKDVWRADLDKSTGKFVQERRLTELGAFVRKRLLLPMWYKDWAILEFKGNEYQIVLFNCNTGEMHPLPFIYPKYVGGQSNIVVSPTGRYSAHSVLDEPDYIFDFQKLEKIQVVNTPHPTSAFAGGWLGNEIYCLIDQTPGNLNLYGLTIPDKKPLFSVQLPHNSYYATDQTKAYYNKKIAINASTDTSYLLGVCETPGLYAQGEVIIIDIPQNRVIKPGIENYYKMPLAWLDNKTFLYGDKTDVLKQGTYLFDVTTQEKHKITTTVADQVVVLQEADIAFFRANDKIYMGSISKRDFKATQHFADRQFFKPLRYEIID